MISIQLTRETNKPLYVQIAEQLRTQIENGQLAPHTRLPASRVLARQLGVNRITIVNAYAELEAEGLVMSRVGSGTFVAWEPAERKFIGREALEQQRADKPQNKLIGLVLLDRGVLRHGQKVIVEGVGEGSWQSVQ